MSATFVRNTTMRQAFLEASVKRCTSAHLIDNCTNSLMKGTGLLRGRATNASLSFRTAQDLKKRGVLPS